MTVTTEHPNPDGANVPEGPPTRVLGRAAGVELCGEVPGSGYKDGTAMVRRADGQMVMLGALMYALLVCVNGERDLEQLAAALSERLRRQVSTEQVAVLARKVGAVGLLAGTEHLAPARRNPLLALRWKVLVTNPRVTRWITAPFAFLFRRLVMWPFLLGFGAVLWYVLVDKGLASATAQAFDRPGLLLLVFALMVGSAAFHEMGHAAACRYGGVTPGGMGMGLYLVWPAFYTDVTEAYRLPRRDRLRVDLGGLYFNAVIADATMVVWLLVRTDALLLLVGLQILLMVKQLSPIIRADGYHILADATGVPDLYAHIGPTLRCLLPWRRREPSALTGRARALVTAWVLILVPVILSLSATAVLLLPRLATTAWDSGRLIAAAIPSQAQHGQWMSVGASIVRLLALLIPLAGSALVTQKVVRTLVAKAWAWSSGHPPRRLLCLLAAVGIAAGLVWAWWPSGQYRPITPRDHGAVGGLPKLFSPSASATKRPVEATGTHLWSVPASAVRNSAFSPSTGRLPGDPVSGGLASEGAPLSGRPASGGGPVSGIRAGTHLAIAAIPIRGASKTNPAYLFLPGTKDQPATAIVAYPTSGDHAQIAPVPATAFPFDLISSITEGPHTRAVAVNNSNGGVLYEIAYSLVTVNGGQPVTDTNSALALAGCQHCTTVAVSFQVVLIVGHSNVIDPINVAEAVNDHCLACVTTAVADQIVVTLNTQPTPQLLAELQAALARLGRLSSLGSGGTPATIAAQVLAVQQQIDAQVNASGLLPTSPSPSSSTVPASTVPPTAPAEISPSTAGSAPAPSTAPRTSDPSTVPAGSSIPSSTSRPSTNPPSPSTARSSTIPPSSVRSSTSAPATTPSSSTAPTSATSSPTS